MHGFLDFSVASVPKRESSRRGAKDKVSQRIKSLHTGDDEEDIQDIDLEDSDDDASWTPFKVGVENWNLREINSMTLSGF